MVQQQKKTNTPTKRSFLKYSGKNSFHQRNKIKPTCELKASIKFRRMGYNILRDLKRKHLSTWNCEFSESIIRE